MKVTDLFLCQVDSAIGVMMCLVMSNMSDKVICAVKTTIICSSEMETPEVRLMGGA